MFLQFAAYLRLSLFFVLRPLEASRLQYLSILFEHNATRQRWMIETTAVLPA